MSLSKLKQIHVIIIGSFLGVAAGVGMFFLLIKPQQDAYALYLDRYNKAVVLGNDAQERKAQDDLKQAYVNAANIQQMYDLRMRQRMPDLDFEDRELGMLSWWREVTKTLDPLLNSFAKDSSVANVQVNFQMPALPYTPNDSLFDQDVIVIPLGSVSASGNFKSLMNNIRRWNRCSRLVMLEAAPTLAGSSPNLTVNYPVRCIIFPRAKGGARIDMAAAGAAGGAPGAPAVPAPPPVPQGPLPGAPGRPPGP
jgi:hypothetical protein